MEARTRAEHMRWCKQRAREYVQVNNLTDAVASMLSDLGKHEETAGLGQGPLAVLGIMAASSGNRREVEKFIEGFAE